jgi:predicted lysophospholipase L1 biosynthesis ABC-type transport system permease subunit
MSLSDNRAHDAQTPKGVATKPSLFRRTTMRRAIAEGVALYAAGVLLALPRPDFWPAPIFVAVLLLRLALFIAPPVWAAMRVVSTRREKMSRRFWRLGPILAACCAAVGLLAALAIGTTDPQWGGLVAGPALLGFFASGKAHVAPLAFFGDQLGWLVRLAIYYTIAVVCTRLANGGFLRFTMPAGNGRVTL